MGGLCFYIPSSLSWEKVLRLHTFQVFECYASVHLIIQYALLLLPNLSIVDADLSIWVMYGGFGPPVNRLDSVYCLLSSGFCHLLQSCYTVT
jgi:hypothetical protein